METWRQPISKVTCAYLALSPFTGPSAHQRLTHCVYHRRADLYPKCFAIFTLVSFLPILAELPSIWTIMHGNLARSFEKANLALNHCGYPI